MGVVPDGVTRVKWVFGGPPGFRGQSASGRPVIVYPKLENNVAVSRAAGLGVSSATWYGLGGRVIASYNQQAQREAEQTQALAASAREPIAAALVEHQARFVPYPGTPGYWVIPGSQGISMAQIRPHGDGGGGNVPVSMALSGGMITTTCCNPGETVWGLVPDGDRTVTVVLAGAAPRTVPVIDNVYSITVTGRITAIIAKDAGGRRITIKAPG